MRWLDGVTNPTDMSASSSGRWWRTGKPGGLQSTGSQRAGHARETSSNNSVSGEGGVLRLEPQGQTSGRTSGRALLFPPWSCPGEPQGPAQASTDFPWPLCPRRAAVLDRLLCLHLRLCIRMPVMGGRGGVNGNGLAGPPQESARLTRESNYDVTAVPLPRRSNWGAPRAQRFLEEKR